MNKKMIGAVGVITLTAALAGCSGGGDTAGGSDDGSGPSQTATIGVIAPLQGSYGEIGGNIVAGVQIAIDEVNAAGGVADGTIKLELKTKDEQNSPQTATQAARDFISDDVTLLTGLFTTSNCGGVAPVIEESPAVFIQTSCAGNELTGVFSGTAPFSRSFGVGGRDQVISTALGQTMAEKFPEVTNYDVFGFDYAWGHATWESYRDTLTDNGVDVRTNEEQWVPLGETNYRSQVSALSRGLTGDVSSRGMFMSTFGAGTAAFLQQAEAFEIADQVELLAGAGEYYAVARSLEGRAPNVWNAYDYNWAAFDTPSNTALVDGYAAMADGEKPVGWTYQGYLAGLAYAAAIDKAGSSDPDAVRDALEGITFDGPSGEVTIGAESHQAEIPVVISNTVGSAESDDGIEVLETVVVPYDELVG